MTTPTFWCEPTDQQRLWLRRYASGSTSGNGHYHQAFSDPIGDFDVEFTDAGAVAYHGVAVPYDDPRWPTTCRDCDYQFDPDDQWQVFANRLYRRTDTDEIVPLREMPPGAMWDAYWMPHLEGPDGICLAVRLPNGRDWIVDGRASNCTKPDDTDHYCWVRHGDPRSGDVTVDKNGDTCAAGAGSIGSGDYHGFLRGGVLT